MKICGNKPSSGGVIIQEDIRRFITSLRYTMAERAADLCQFDLDNPGGKFSSSKFFSPGNFVEVRMGYGNELVLLGKCRIKNLTADYPEDGIPKLSVKALGGESLLAVEPDTGDERTFAAMAPADFVKKVADKFGMEAVTLATPTTTNIYIQRGKTFAETLRAVAAELRYEFFVRFDEGKGAFELHFHPMGFYKEPEQPQYVFNYNYGEKTTLLSFKPSEDLEGQISDIEFVAWDHANKKAVIIKLTHSSDKGLELNVRQGDPSTELTEPVMDGSAAKVVAFGKTRLTSLEDVHTIEDFKDFAERKFKEYKDGFVTGKGSCIGVETLRPGQKHTLKGIGRFEGNYYLTQVQHNFDKSGFMTSFNAYRDLE